MGGRIKAARKRAKFMQADLAQRVGINQGTLSKIERGRLAISAEHAAAIAKLCGVSLTRLLADSAHNAAPPAAVLHHARSAR